MKKVLLISGSPRSGANGDAMLSSAEKALSEAGAEIIRFNIRDKKVNPCVCCMECKKPAADGCVQPDDMSPLIPVIKDCDAIIFNTPIYFQHVTAQSKTFIDRMYCMFNPMKPPVPSGQESKKLGIILTFGTADPVVMENEIGGFVRRSFDLSGITDSQVVLAPGCRFPTSTADNPEQLKAAYDLGKWIAE